MQTDTIAGIASGMGGGGIGIIRVSGKNALKSVDNIFFSKKYADSHKNIDFSDWKSRRLQDGDSHRVYYGYIVDNGQVIDEVIVLTMKAPNSYTVEDVVEIDCHGGPFVIKKILEILFKQGIRMAEPGEFTKRAFLNGRIDLSQAEAVMDIIKSNNDDALKSSIDQLHGNISEKIKEIREIILNDVAFIESALDDPEHYSVDGFSDDLKRHVGLCREKLQHLYNSSDDGRIITEGIHTLIVGKPNAGKSSLMNLIMGQERAIVTEVAGTTRDTLEETVNLDGMILRIIDTAGIHNTEDIVEKIGVDKTIENIDKADFIIYVVDSSVPFDNSDERIIELIQEKNAVVLLNKSDLPPVISKSEIQKKIDRDVIEFSTKQADCLDKLIRYMKDKFYHGDIGFNREIYITNVRHKEAVFKSIESLDEVIQSIDMNMPEDFYAIDLMQAYQTLGNIIGETVEDDLVEKIFKEFCMGK